MLTITAEWLKGLELVSCTANCCLGKVGAVVHSANSPPRQGQGHNANRHMSSAQKVWSKLATMLTTGLRMIGVMMLAATLGKVEADEQEGAWLNAKNLMIYTV